MVLCDCEVVIILSLFNAGVKDQCTREESICCQINECAERRLVYVMSQFNVRSNSGGFRAAKHGFKLNFQFQTRIAETDDDESIERYGFEFLPASRIFAPNFDHDILVDVIGRPIHMGDIQQASSDPKTKRLNIQLGIKYIPEINEFISELHPEELSSPINQSLLNSDVPPSPIEAAFYDWSLSSIQDFYHATDSTVYVILASVLKVNVERGSYYDSCKKCMKQKLLTVYYSKYNVELLILDDSGTANVTVFDKDVEAFLGISTIDLRKEHLQVIHVQFFNI
ncbi:hypothetical protein G2W53_037320 [Senna tora]|uniref:Replication factor A C-terminal domain-containing protein n=1 Tax=Senna tora TaxID=362788 RepID=A0A834W5Z0_9FABA|nr:hypothetical protein G2W53_037320 [Senna tora]